MPRWLKLGGLSLAGMMILLPLMDRFGGPPTDNSRCGDLMGAIKAHRASIEAVEAQLKSPRSAEFSSLRDSRVSRLDGQCRFRVEGYVDAQNSLGAVVRKTFVAQVVGSETEPFKATAVELKR